MSNTIKLLVVGRIKEPWIRDAVAEFEKRLTRFAKFSVLELKDSNPEKEGIEISSRVKGIVYLLDETGVEYTSEGFAQLVQKHDEKEITFVIGSASGFSADVKKSYPKIALSKMTFTHEMARLFFTEQLYRAECILNNVPYHKR